MHCPFCDHHDSLVKDSRSSDGGKIIRRRRYCPECHNKFTTFERIELKQLLVYKKSGSKKPFDRSKIFNSIATALRKRNFTHDDIEKLTETITLTIQNANKQLISSRDIGKLIMHELAKIDPVAYVRFASVYNDFTRIQDFARFINSLEHKLK